MPKEYTYIKKPVVISLGFDCGPRLLINRTNIKQPTFPFDWLHSYGGFSKIIINGYNPFNIIMLEKSPLFPDSNLLLDLNNDILYFHDNKNNLEIKYKRRLDRLKQYLHIYNTSTNNQKVIFIRKSHDIKYHKIMDNIIGQYKYKFKNDVEDAQELNKYLVNTYPKLNFKIYVYLMCNKCYSKYKYNLFTIDKNIIIKRNKYVDKFKNIIVEPPLFKQMFYPILDEVKMSA